jgi:metal-responsive CopG/Arc/MetJ family transcriptional regulator
MSRKRTISVSLDVDLVKELDASPGPRSSQINEAVRADVEQRRRNRQLDVWLRQLAVNAGRSTSPWCGRTWICSPD